MNAPSETPVQSRRIGRSVLAVVAGIVLGIFLSVGTDLGMRVAGFAPPQSQRWPDQLLLLATVYRSIYGVMAGYVIAWLAPSRPMAHSLIAGALGTLVSALGAAAAWSTTAGQHWYPLALALTALPTAWLGAKLRLMRSEAAAA